MGRIKYVALALIVFVVLVALVVYDNPFESVDYRESTTTYNQGYIEWNGNKYTPYAVWAAIPNIEKDGYLGRVSGYERCVAYRIKHDDSGEYLLIIHWGVMTDWLVYRNETSS